MRFALSFPLLVAALATSACCGPSGQVRASLAPWKIEGFAHAFSYPRPDIFPGTVLVRFDNTPDVFVLCQPNVPGVVAGDFGGTGELQSATPISYTEERKSEITTNVKASAKSVAEVQFGSESVQDVSISLSFTARIARDAGSDARQAEGTAVCKQNFAQYKQAHPEVKHASVVTEVAETTVDYTIQLKQEVTAGGGLSDDLAKKLGVGAKATVDASDKRKIHIVGAKLIANYNAEDGLAKL